MGSKCLGTIKVDGPLIVSDPCYLKADEPFLRDGLTGRVEGIPAGVYPVWIETEDKGEWGTRVSTLRIEIEEGARGHKRQVGTLGVDSGQMAFVSESLVPEWGGDPRDEREWLRLCREEYDAGHFNYPAVCHATRADGHGIATRSFGGVLLDKIAVSESGFGDGSYPLYVTTLDGNVTAVTVEFLEEDEEDEDEECDHSDHVAGPDGRCPECGEQIEEEADDDE